MPDGREALQSAAIEKARKEVGEGESPDGLGLWLIGTRSDVQSEKGATMLATRQASLHSMTGPRLPMTTPLL